MTGKSYEGYHLNRRDLLIGLSATTILLASGCALFSNESELDSAFTDLDAYLRQIPGADTQSLISTSDHLQQTIRRLIRAHDRFVTVFNDKASRYSVSEMELEALVLDYDIQRRTLRKEMLEVQDQLLAGIPPQSWSEVLEILNRKSQKIATSNV
jgi:hypothetical protein